MKDYLLIGHFSKDLMEDKKFTLGGSVYFSGITAKKLGQKVKILTSFSNDLLLKLEKNLLNEFEIENIPSKESTTFRNIYLNKNRVQFLEKIAKKISPRSISKEWKNANIVQIAPIANEVDEKIIKKFKNSLIGATLQGWLRKRNKQNRVLFSFWKNYKEYLPLIDVAILSEEDIHFDLKVAKEYSKFAKILVLTQGEKGCLVFYKRKIKQFKPKKILKKGNFTGAGDVFAAGFLIEFKKSGDFFQSAQFANFLAGFHVEKGIENFRFSS